MTEEEIIDVEEVEEETRNLPAVLASQAMVARGELSVEEIVAQKDKIKQIMEAVMTEGVHYGRIPGVDKPSLFKPGAEAIDVALRLAPHYESEKIWHDDGHLTVVAKCVLKHIPTDLTIATGEGLCTTKEERYAFRQSKRSCPNCGVEAIIKGKAEYGGGWVCWKKEGGCGSTFPDGAHEIESQKEGKVPNPNIADLYNTVLKMADKRSLIAAVLNGTAASDVFTQDAEDRPRATGTPPPARIEGPDPLPSPSSWAKITEYISAYDQVTYEDFNKFADAARRRLFPDSESTSSLEKAQKDELFRAAAKAALALRNAVDSTKFPPPTHDDLRRAWAAAMDGEELSIGEDDDA
jgi:hypothetical protein